MSYVNLLEGKIKLLGRDILSIQGQVRNHIIEPQINVLITGVMYGEQIEPPYKQWDLTSLEEFTKRLYEFRKSFNEKSKFVIPNSEVHIEIKSVLEDTG